MNHLSKTPIATVPIPLASGKVGYVAAGPTRDLPDTHKLIRCAVEIPVPDNRIAFDLGTKDFTPFDDALIRARLPGILRAVEGGARLYVGCMGGTGRTGTLLALMVAQHPSFSGQQAIDYIRAVYRKGAVETAEQEEQVRDFGALKFTRPDAFVELTDEEIENVFEGAEKAIFQSVRGNPERQRRRNFLARFFGMG